MCFKSTCFLKCFSISQNRLRVFTLFSDGEPHIVFQSFSRFRFLRLHLVLDLTWWFIAEMVIHPYRQAAVTKFPPNIDAKAAATPGFSVTRLLLGEDPPLSCPLLYFLLLSFLFLSSSLLPFTTTVVKFLICDWLFPVLMVLSASVFNVIRCGLPWNLLSCCAQ